MWQWKQVRYLALGGAALVSACASLPDFPELSSLALSEVRNGPEALRPGSYELDPQHAHLYFAINHMGLSLLYGRFDTFDANFSVDDSLTGASDFEMVIDVNSLFVSTEAFSETLRGDGWFNAEEHPQAVFRAREITRMDERTGLLSGDLTLNGRTQPVEIRLIFNGGAFVALTGKYTVGFNAEGSFNRSDFGLGQYAGLVGDEVQLRFSGEFHQIE